MMYVVTGEFSQTYGSQVMKWRARREVVEWLQSFISRPSLDLDMDDSIQGFGSLEVSTICGSLAYQTYVSDQMVPRKLKVREANIEWSGVSWICTKQLKHYPAFSINGNSIAVHSFVFILAEEESHYVGYLEDMYEDRKGRKKVKVRWFHHNQEVKRVILQLNAHPREVFITAHVQVISAGSIDSPATVLTPTHYEKYGPLVSNQKIKCYKSNAGDKEDLADSATASGKRNRSGQGQEGLENGSSVSNSVPENQAIKCEPTYPKLRLRFSGMGNVAQPQFPRTFMVGEKIELLSEDSGI